MFWCFQTRDREGGDRRFGLAGRDKLGHDVADAGAELKAMAAEAEGVMQCRRPWLTGP